MSNREIGEKKKIDKDLNILKAKLAFKEIELKNQKTQCDEKEEKILHLSDSLKEAKMIAEKASKELQFMNMQV